MNKAKKFIDFLSESADELPKLVQLALSRSDKDYNWVWFHSSTQHDRDEFEKYLVDIKDPLAFEPGNAEWRFKAFMKRRAK